MGSLTVETGSVGATTRRRGDSCWATLAATLLLVPFAVGGEEYEAVEGWIAPGAAGELAKYSEFANEHGRLGVLNESGPINTGEHPFFLPLGTNGRACVTCHQPSDGMSISVATIRKVWESTQGKDPLFAATDGSNCPSLPQDKKSSHSLLVERGLFRISLPWPPKPAWDGSPVVPEFELSVVRDPTGCNLDRKYGLTSDKPTVSVFRRPRPAANMKYIFPTRLPLFNVKTSEPLERDPETGRRVHMNLMSDSRFPALSSQAADAAFSHMQRSSPLGKKQIDEIVSFQNQVYVAQTGDLVGGNLVESGGPPGLGPLALAGARTGLLGDYLDTPVFQNFDAWKGLSGSPQADFRASVERGADNFLSKLFWIRDAYGINHVGLGNPLKRTCTTCHHAQMTGMDLVPGWMDIGIANQPWTNDPDLPLFKVKCHDSAAPHPYLGREILTHDPGRALITGRCRDVGAIIMQQLRGLSARAPYFSNGRAKDLRGIIDYYDERFTIGYTEQEKQDLVNFLGVL